MFLRPSTGQFHRDPLFPQPARAYWRASLEKGGGSAPPDCFSSDGEHGTGDPGGDCFSCPMNQWASADKGHGKACKEKRLLFLLRPDSVLPVVVQVPSTSIQNVKRYFLRLLDNKMSHWMVVTRLALEPAQSGGGITYSRVVLTVASVVPEDQRERGSRHTWAPSSLCWANGPQRWTGQSKPWTRGSL